jgi:hypothetical protein
LLLKPVDFGPNAVLRLACRVRHDRDVAAPWGLSSRQLKC